VSRTALKVTHLNCPNKLESLVCGDGVKYKAWEVLLFSLKTTKQGGIYQTQFTHTPLFTSPVITTTYNTTQHSTSTMVQFFFSLRISSAETISDIDIHMIQWINLGNFVARTPCYVDLTKTGERPHAHGIWQGYIRISRINYRVYTYMSLG
jgi:hypothetical protein